MIKCRKFQWTGHLASMGECRIIFNIVTSIPTERISLGRPGWEDGIRMDPNDMRKLIELIRLRIGINGDSFEFGMTSRFYNPFN